MPICSSPPTSFRWPSPSLRYVARSTGKASISVDWRRSSIVRDTRREKSAVSVELVSSLRRLRCRTLQETLSRRSLPQRLIPVEVRRHPAAESLGVEHGAVAWVVVAHAGQGFGEPPLQLRIDTGPDR